ncbi:MAG TPA: hypothetical protein VLA52_11910, partial [Thermohalobaculum sp.]|nr:hypothetical protein [Thermohalobaculum sp.]
PTRVSLTSETAPPPLNPRLQYCMEEYVYEQVTENGGSLRQAIEGARALNYSALPDELRDQVTGSFDMASEALVHIVAAKEADAETEANAADYRPLLRVVRQIESEIRDLDAEIDELTVRIRRADAGSPRRERLEARKAELTAERDAHKAEIPGDWASARKAFSEYTKAERFARIKYRRAVDEAYEPVKIVTALLRSNDEFQAIREDFGTLLSGFREMEPDAITAQLGALDDRIAEVPYSDEIRAQMARARTLLSGGAQIAQASRAMIDVNIAFNGELRWRNQANAALGEQFLAYEEAIRDTIGLRGQPRLPEEQALYVAACSSHHRDISLSF